MKHRVRSLRGLPPTAGVLLGLWALALATPAFGNEVLQWNETTMKAIATNGQNNIVSTRTLAMVHVAVHDALNAIDRRYDAYYFEGPGDRAASPEAAVAGPARRRSRPEQGRGGRARGRRGDPRAAEG